MKPHFEFREIGNSVAAVCEYVGVPTSLVLHEMLISEQIPNMARPINERAAAPISRAFVPGTPESSIHLGMSAWESRYCGGLHARSAAWPSAGARFPVQVRCPFAPH